MNIVRSIFRSVAAVIVAMVACAPHSALGNHFILPCGEKCDFATPFAYVGNTSSNYVTVVDTTTNEVVGTVDVGQTTSGVVVNPAGTRVYAANSRSIVVIDTGANEVVATITYGTTSETVAAVVVNPAGTRVYVTDFSRRGIAVIDAATNAVVAWIITGYQPFGLAVNPEGSRVYATNTYQDTISVIDALTNTVVASIPIDNYFSDPPTIAGDFSAGPVGIAVDPAGKFAYVTNAFLRNPVNGNLYLSVIDTVTNSIVDSVPIGPSWARGVAVDHAGMQVYLSNGAVLDIATNTVTHADFSSSFNGLAIDPSEARIFVPKETPPGLLVYDTDLDAVVATIPMTGTPMAFGQFVRPVANDAPARRSRVAKVLRSSSSP